jgi:hypothetical protein
MENVGCADMDNINSGIGHEGLGCHSIRNVALLGSHLGFLYGDCRNGVNVIARSSDGADVDFTNKAHTDDASIML